MRFPNRPSADPMRAVTITASAAEVKGKWSVFAIQGRKGYKGI